MSRYETYKPSGIDWIGNVPKDWKILRIKNVASIVNGSTPSSSVEEYWDGDIIWATPGDFNKFDKIIDDSESKITEAGYKSCGTSLVPVGSVVITTRAPIGNVLIAGKELCTNQGCKTLVPNRIESRFLYYIISISSIELNILGQGTTFLELSKESLGTFKLPLPEYEEQLSIAKYLDDQTQKIDRLIANKKAQAEKLKELRQIEINNAVTKGLNPNAEMKDSGIEWLGKIPKHWEVKRTKNICQIVNGSTPSSSIESYWDGDIIWVTPGDFKNFEHTINDSDSKITAEGYKNCGTSLVPIGSVILTTRAPIGNVLIASKELCTNQGCKSLIPVRINSEFLYYYVSISSIQLNVLGQGTTFLELSTGNLSTFKVPLPPKEEQEEIVKHLQKRTTAIDQLIKNIEVQIEKLQELRKIKIYEAVTGKIKVNAYAETTA
jgi:type I restriction enzyme S subunit